MALGAIEVWNYNAEWQTADGVRKADVAVSPDGTTWQTVLRGAEFAEAEGNCGLRRADTIEAQRRDGAQGPIREHCAVE